MADNNVNNNIKTTVEFDVNQAQQEIVKLNSLASDSTQDLQKRLDAKNKAIELQNKLNEKNIKDLERLIKDLTGVEGKEKDLIKAQEKLNKAKLNEVKVNEKNSKSQKKLSKGYKDSQSSLKNLDKATGGWAARLTALAANPIVLTITALVGGLALLKEAFTSSEEGQNRWAKAVAITEALLGNLLDLVADFAEFLVDAIQKPGEAWDSLVETFKKGFDFINRQVIDRFMGNWMQLTGNFEKGVLKMRIAWNEFTGDSEEASKLTGALDEVNKKIGEGVGLITKANEKIAKLYDDAKGAVSDFIDEQEKEVESAGRVADMRAKADKIERELIVERSKAESKIAQLRLKAREDDKFSAQERKKALIEAQALEDSLIDKETEYLELRRDAQILENTFSRSNKENLKKEAEAIAAVNKQIAARANVARQLQREFLRVDAQVKKEEAAKAKEEEKNILAIDKFKKAIALEDKNNLYAKIDEERKLRLKELEELKLNEEAKAQLKLDVEAKYKAQKDEIDKAEAEKKKEKEQLDKEQLLIQEELELQRKREKDELTLQEELAFLEKKRLQEVEQEGLRQSQIDTINKRYALEKERIKEAEIKAEKAKDKAIFDSAVMMAGEAFGVAQELALARMIMNAPEAISNVWTQAAKKPTIPQVIAHGVIGSATVIAPIVKGVKDIKKARMSGRASSAGAGGGGNISANIGGGAGGGIPTATTTQISDLTARNEARSSSDVRLSGRATRNASANVQAGKSSNIVFSESRYRDFQDQVSFKEQKSTI